jgi:hypothetical protein
MLRFLAQWWWLVAAFIIGGILSVWIVWSSNTFQECANLAQNSACHEHLEKDKPTITSALSRYGNCFGVFVDKKSGAISAATAVVVMLLTFVLAIVGYRQAVAAKENLTIGQRAYILMKPPKMDKAWFQDDKYPSGQCLMIYVGLRLRNAGRTPATIKRLRCGFRYFESLPINPDYSTREFRDYGRRVPLSGDTTLNRYITRPHPAYLTIEQLKTISPQSNLYFIGFVEYADVFGNSHETRFCYIINPVSDPPEALVRGDDPYNGNT